MLFCVTYGNVDVKEMWWNDKTEKCDDDDNNDNDGDDDDGDDNGIDWDNDSDVDSSRANSLQGIKTQLVTVLLLLFCKIHRDFEKILFWTHDNQIYSSYSRQLNIFFGPAKKQRQMV